MSATPAFDQTSVDMIELCAASYHTTISVPGWQVAWGPENSSDGANLVFVAQNTSPDVQQYAVCIRGTVWTSLQDVLEDMEVSTQLPLVIGNRSFGNIAKGTSDGIGEILGIESGSLQAYLQGLPSSADIVVTGHSLGGCLATVLACYVASWRTEGSSGLYVRTFAAPTAGDASFASAYDALWPRPVVGSLPNSIRFYNQLDVVPMAWWAVSQSPGIYKTHGVYSGTVKLFCDLVAKHIQPLGYTQPG